MEASLMGDSPHKDSISKEPTRRNQNLITGWGQSPT